MYKYYNKNGIMIMEYSFTSLKEFLDYLAKTPTNYSIWGEWLGSHIKDYTFCQTESFEEACDLCKYGYHEDMEKLVDLKLKLEKYIKLSKKRNRQYDDYIGYAANVKAYLEGSPISMLNKKNEAKKHIDIYYNSAILSNTSTDQIYNRGAITLSIVNILENMGFSVGLNIFTMSEEANQIHYAKFNLKRSDERLNIQRLYFPLCHPSFLRRLVFRLKEETPDIKPNWYPYYGKTSNENTIRKIINLNKNDIVICSPDDMGIQGYNIIDDANAMFNYINKFTEEDLKLEKIKIKN